MAKRRLYKCRQSYKGTGNVLQDLLCSSVFIKKLKLNHEPVTCKSTILGGDKNEGFCSICHGDKEKVHPTTQKEMNILKDFILKTWSAENIVTSSGLEFSWICILCSRTLERLDKCSKEIEDIVFCLRTIIRMQKHQIGISGQRSNSMVSSKGIKVSDMSIETNVAYCRSTKRIEMDFDKINVRDPVVQGPLQITPPLEFEMTDIDTEDEGGDDIATVSNEEDLIEGLPLDSASSDCAGDSVRDPAAEKSLEPLLDQVQGGSGSVCNGQEIDKSIKPMDLHQMEIIKDKPSCDECGKTFTRMEHRIRHQNNEGIHERQSQKGFNCKNCSKRFFTVKLRRHECDYDNDKVEDEEELKPVVVNLEFDMEDENELENERTDMASTHSKSGMTDYSQIQKDPTQLKIINQAPLVVDSSFGNKGIVTEIETDTDKPKIGLRRRKCTCPNCTGVDAVNNGERNKKHLCHIPGCGKVYSRTSHLHAHLRMHAEERPFVCQWLRCGKRFYRSDELQRHREIHTGDKPFQCQKCPKKFPRSDHLSRHMKIHSDLTGATELANADGEASSDNEKANGEPLRSNSTDNTETPKSVNMEVDNVEIRTKRQSRARAEDKIQSLAKNENTSDSEDGDNDVDEGDSNYEGQASASDSDDSLVEIEAKSLSQHSVTQHPNNMDKCQDGIKELEQPPVRCQPCNKTFKKARDYREHLVTVKHAKMLGEDAVIDLQKKRNFKCQKCDKSFHSAIRLQTHNYNHTRPFVCETCGKQFPQQGFLQQHQKTHTRPIKVPNRFVDPKDKSFSCKICGKQFAGKSGMFRHLKVIHKGHRYKCDLCPKDFSALGVLRNHQNNFHSQNKRKPTPKLLRLQCEMCAKTVAGKSFMVRHIELVHFPQQSSCPYGCHGNFETKKEWITHLEQCKSDKMTLQSKCFCYYCGAVFSNQLLRISHHFDLHTTHSCKFCSALFSQKQILDYHTNSHQESKPHLCSKCGKRFKQPNNLRLHSTTVCGDDEDAKKELLIKRREQHRMFRGKEKPYKCDVCSKGFVEERRLAAHKLQKHADKDESGEDDDGT